MEKVICLFYRCLKFLEKGQVESHQRFLCLDGDSDILYSLLKKSEKFMTKGKAKELLKYTINLDCNLRQSIPAKSATIDPEDGVDTSSDEGMDSECVDTPDSGPAMKRLAEPICTDEFTQTVTSEDKFTQTLSNNY